jgi:hypothetical protein
LFLHEKPILNTTIYSQQANANTNNEINNKIQNTSATASAPPIMQALPTAGIIVEVNHVVYSRTFYFQLSRKL